MGTESVVRHAPAMTEERLGVWFSSQLYSMASESGTDSYCGNWNCNDGLEILSSRKPLTLLEAEALLEGKAKKRGPVLAVRVGDFSKVFPVTTADTQLVQRQAEAERTLRLFDWSILARAKRAKSRTKKCPKCESSINVHALHSPSEKEILEPAGGGLDVPSLVHSRGRFWLVSMHTLTACPVCESEFLRTETDSKAETALKAKLKDLNDKVAKAKTAQQAKTSGAANPYWLVRGDCAS